MTLSGLYEFRNRFHRRENPPRTTLYKPRVQPRPDEKQTGYRHEKVPTVQEESIRVINNFYTYIIQTKITSELPEHSVTQGIPRY